jgi:hypothetical protein
METRMRFYYYLNEAVYKINMSFIDNMLTDLEKEVTKKMWFFKGRKLKILNRKFKGIDITFELNNAPPIVRATSSSSSYKSDDGTGILGATTFLKEKKIVIGVDKTFLKNLNDKKKWVFVKRTILNLIEHELIHIKQLLDGFFKKGNILYKAKSEEQTEIYREYLSDKAEIMTYANTIAKEVKKFCKHFSINEDPATFFQFVWNKTEEYIECTNDIPTLFAYFYLFPDKNSEVMKLLHEYVLEYLE